MIEIICVGVSLATWIVAGYFYSKWEGKKIDAKPEPIVIAEMAEVGDC